MAQIEARRGWRPTGDRVGTSAGSWACPTSNARHEHPGLAPHRCLVDAAEHAFLPPHAALREDAVLVKAAHQGARAGAAGRAVEGPVGAEHERLAVVARLRRRPEEHDVVDRFPGIAGDAASLECPADRPGAVREPRDLDAAPNLGPTEALAMQGRYLGMPR